MTSNPMRDRDGELFRRGADEMLSLFIRYRLSSLRGAALNALDRLVADWRDGRVVVADLDTLVLRATCGSPPPRMERDEDYFAGPDMRAHRRGVHQMLTFLLDTRPALTQPELEQLAAEIAAWRRYEVKTWALGDVVSDLVRRVRAVPSCP